MTRLLLRHRIDNIHRLINRIAAQHHTHWWLPLDVMFQQWAQQEFGERQRMSWQWYLHEHQLYRTFLDDVVRACALYTTHDDIVATDHIPVVGVTDHMLWYGKPNASAALTTIAKARHSGTWTTTESQLLLDHDMFNRHHQLKETP